MRTLRKANPMAICGGHIHLWWTYSIVEICKYSYSNKGQNHEIQLVRGTKERKKERKGIGINNDTTKRSCSCNNLITDTLTKKNCNRTTLGTVYRNNYSRTSLARTSLGPWKFVRDMGRSSHYELTMAPGQEFREFFFFYHLYNNGMLSVLIRVATMRIV